MCLGVELEALIALLGDLLQASKQENLVAMQVKTVTTSRLWNSTVLPDSAPVIGINIKSPHIVQSVVSLSQSAKQV